MYSLQGWGQVQYLYLVLVLTYIFISTWYLYLRTYLSVLDDVLDDVLEYLVYGNVKVLVLVLGQKVLGTYKQFSSTIY